MRQHWRQCEGKQSRRARDEITHEHDEVLYSYSVMVAW